MKPRFHCSFFEGKATRARTVRRAHARRTTTTAKHRRTQPSSTRPDHPRTAPHLHRHVLPVRALLVRAAPSTTQPRPARLICPSHTASTPHHNRHAMPKLAAPSRHSPHLDRRNVHELAKPKRCLTAPRLDRQAQPRHNVAYRTPPRPPRHATTHRRCAYPTPHHQGLTAKPELSSPHGVGARQAKAHLHVTASPCRTRPNLAQPNRDRTARRNRAELYLSSTCHDRQAKPRATESNQPAPDRNPPDRNRQAKPRAT